MSFLSSPRYSINLINAQSIWTPEPHQMLNWPNPSRLNSLWLGLVAPLIMLPGRLWNEVIRVAARGHVGSAAVMLGFIWSSSLLWAGWGLRGDAFALDLDPETLMWSRFLTPDQAIEALMAGDNDVITRLPR